jgi:hypothetical protein
MPKTYAESLAQRHSDVGFIMAQLRREYGSHGLTRGQVEAMRRKSRPVCQPKMLRHVTDDLIRKQDFEQYVETVKADNILVAKLQEAQGIKPKPAPLREIQVPDQSEPVGYREVIAQIAYYMDVSVADIMGKDRRNEYLQARMVAYKVLADRGNSFAQIGRWIGGRDHSTVMNGIKRFNRIATPLMLKIAAKWAEV